jgi:hypothetical protein
MTWIDVKVQMPPIDDIVLIQLASGCICFGGRVYCDGEGWMWGVTPFNAVHDKDGWNELIVDDDYDVTHWADLEPSP